MREIKFRLRLDDKVVGYEKWYCGERAPDENRPEERYWRANPCWLYSEDGKYWKPTSIFHNHKDQYTGLKDKNGVEIYEGDIIATWDEEGTRYLDSIGWNDEQLCWGVKTDKGYEITLGEIADHDIEVIGNIHEEVKRCQPES